MWPALLAGVLTFVFAQTADRWYEGKWAAEFQGVTFMRIELAPNNGKLGGRMSVGGSIEVNPDGGLRAVTPASGRFAEIFDVTVNGNVVTFSHKDGRDVDRYEIRRTGEQAELVFLLSDEARKEIAAEGIPVPKPIPLKKAQGR